MKNADFSGYATKANLKCTDGRTIMSNAFAHMHGETVPLVWQHGHKDLNNVLGHMVLESRDGDVYAHGFFNDTPQGVNAKALVKHGDITALSIYANRLQETNKNVAHGMIREVSLVMSGANPGAFIDSVNIAHTDGDISTADNEAIIYTDLSLFHSEEDSEEDSEESEESNMEHSERTIQDVFDTFNEEQAGAVDYMLEKALQHAAGDKDDDADSGDDSGSAEDKTVQQIFDSMTEDQKNVTYFLIGEAVKDAKKGSSSSDSDSDSDSDNAKTSAKHSDTLEGTTMTHNAFESDSINGSESGSKTHTLSHADIKDIFKGAERNGSLQEAVESYALQHSIQDIDILFPDAKSVTATPEFLKRRTEWVDEVMKGTRHTPFSRIKSLAANLTLEDARAKGYVKGNLKKEEFFRVSKRSTTPQTVYKKQKLDRDDILDITDFDVVAWLKGEMRLMLEEEIARAILISDGREAGDEDKINEDHIRPISKDDELYVTYLYVNLTDANSSSEEIIDALTLQRRHYRGSGNPTFFTSETILAKLLLIKDGMGRRIYPTVNDLSAALRVSKIVAVEAMDEPTVDVIGILVNLTDYVVGADKGGDVSMFEDFDIDYNQNKYLIETRISGALVKPKSALVVKSVAGAAVLVTPVAPTWDDSAKTVTVATTTGIVYKNQKTNATLTTGSPVTLTDGQELTVIAVPASSGYYLASSAANEFTFTHDDGPVGGPF